MTLKRPAWLTAANVCTPVAFIVIPTIVLGIDLAGPASGSAPFPFGWWSANLYLGPLAVFYGIAGFWSRRERQAADRAMVRLIEKERRMGLDIAANVRAALENAPTDAQVELTISVVPDGIKTMLTAGTPSRADTRH